MVQRYKADFYKRWQGSTCMCPTCFKQKGPSKLAKLLRRISKRSLRNKRKAELKEEPQSYN